MLPLGSNKKENNAVLHLSNKHTFPTILTFLKSGCVLQAVNATAVVRSILFFLEVHKVMMYPNHDSSDLMKVGNSNACSTSYLPGAILTALHVLTH